MNTRVSALFSNPMIVLLIAFVGLTAACTERPTKVPELVLDRDSGFTVEPCPEPMQDKVETRFTCGTLSVAQEADRPEGLTLKIKVFVAQPLNARPDPVFVLHGGPGVPALAGVIELLSGSADDVTSLLGGRTWVFFDQRGVGMSSPALVCPQPGAVMGEEAALRACAEGLQRAGVVLSAYTSVTAAGDIDALRRALGFDQINLLGASYGSRLAFTYARLFPQQVRAIVHDGPYRPAEQETVDDARGTAIVFDRIFARCAADTRCARRYPDLRARYLARVSSLAADPLGALNDEAAVALVQWPAFDHQIDGIPKLMDDIATGPSAEIRKMFDEPTRFELPVEEPAQAYAVAQGLSVDCNEEKTFETAAEFAAARGRSPVVDAQLRNADQLLAICAIWPSGHADPVDNQPVIVAAPQLVLTGEFDASQSGFVGQRIVAEQPRARDVMFTDTGHVQIVGPKSECALGLITRFLNTLDPAALDARCATAGRIQWE